MNSDFHPRVTACVVAHNEERSIEGCLTALFEQSFEWPYEIMLIDNASSDATVEVAERVARRFVDSRAVRFSVIRRKSNNLGAARQMALENATAPSLAFTDADCVVPLHWLATLESTLDSNRERGVVAVGTSNQPPRNGSAFHHAQRLMFSNVLGHFGSEQAKRGSGTQREVAHLPTCSVIYDRDALVAAGGFANSHRWVCEDVDVSYKLRARDAKLLKIDSVEVEHRTRTSFRGWSRKIFRYGWGQIQVMRNVREHRRWKYLVPALFALSFPISALFGTEALVAWAVAYAFGIVAVSIFLSVRARRPRLLFIMIPLYAITHFSYGAGLLAGVAGWSGGRRTRG
jgi:cellulose synthase/poly-beta-1,6-N-acetylglucosamine synthase-like glycosyltransferase